MEIGTDVRMEPGPVARGAISSLVELLMPATNAREFRNIARTPNVLVPAHGGPSGDEPDRTTRPASASAAVKEANLQA